MQSLPRALFKLSQRLIGQPPSLPPSLREAMINLNQRWYTIDLAWKQLKDRVRSSNQETDKVLGRALADLVVQEPSRQYRSVETVWKSLLATVKAREAVDEVKEGFLDMAAVALGFYLHLESQPTTFEASVTVDQLKAISTSDFCSQCRKQGRPIGLIPYPGGPRWRFECAQCKNTWVVADRQDDLPDETPDDEDE